MPIFIVSFELGETISHSDVYLPDTTQSYGEFKCLSRQTFTIYLCVGMC